MSEPQLPNPVMSVRVDVHIESRDYRLGPGSMRLSQEFPIPREVSIHDAGELLVKIGDLCKQMQTGK